MNKQNFLEIYEDILRKKRGYVSKLPENKKAVMILSGGLDSIVTTARLIKDFDMKIFPLHIHRGQTNTVAENMSVDFFTEYFKKEFPGKFHDPLKINVNVPPIEFKKDLIPYMKEKGHPMRDPIMHLLAVEYAVAVSNQVNEKVKTIFCAIVPEDYFPHSSLAGLRVNTLNVCENLGDPEWLITSPNIDTNISEHKFGKVEEIQWAMKNNISIGKSISCNDANESTKYLNCGVCKSCHRRQEAFRMAGFEDPTEYANLVK